MYFSAAKRQCQCHKNIWLKQNPCQRHVLNCDNQRWYSKRLLWTIHASWHFCEQRLASHYVMTFFTVICSAKCHWHNHDKFRQKKRSASRALLWWSEVRIKQLVRPSYAWWHSVQPTVSHLIVMGDMRCLLVVPRNKMSMVSCSVWPDRPSNQTERESMHFAAWDHTPSILQECRDYHRQKMSPSEWWRIWC